METSVILKKQNLTHLKWALVRSSSGTAGTFLKSEATLSGRKIYYKLSDFDRNNGVVGHECINEIIVDRLLSILGVEHLHYQLIYADIELDGKVHTTYLCASEDFKILGENKIALDNYYTNNHIDNESPYEFCQRLGFKDYIDTMLAVDYIICNRDRHGANIEVLRNSRKHSLRIAPMFDQGLSLLFSCHSPQSIRDFDVMRDIPCNNFIGSRSPLENLSYLDGRKVFSGILKGTDKGVLFQGLDNAISDEHRDKIWSMIWQRYQLYENL